jgi:hypothetical protein
MSARSSNCGGTRRLKSSVGASSIDPSDDRTADDLDRNYVELRQRIKDLVQLTTPRGATVLFVSKGDDELLDVPARRGWHFPRAVNGLYAGCYPADGREAIKQLRRLQAKGATHLVIPRSSYWWLEFYAEFTRRLERKHVLTAFQEAVCVVYRLVDPTERPSRDDASDR